jgi:hypothetical protein
MTPAKQRWLVSLARLELLISRRDFDLIEDAEREYFRASVAFTRELAQ